jgi:hypothetical protein
MQAGDAAGSPSYPGAMSLSQPSRTIVVEPVQAPAEPAPAEAPPPVEAPAAPGAPALEPAGT